ncbi:MAG: hypothetical protein GY906_07160 [bacterium]|nr:hypothetical protein [bacterium]
MLETSRKFCSRHGWGIVFLLGVASVAPSVFSGFILDDLIYMEILEGRIEGFPPSRDLFEFFSGDAATMMDHAEKGDVPWWVWDELKIVFFRPLSELLWRVDFALFGRHAVFYHLHSLLWWALLLAAVGALLRRVLPPTAALLAFALFALDESHSLPAAWISNRNALVALAPAMLGILAHLRWREEGWRPGSWLAPTFMVISLLGGETGLAGFAYLFAYELFRRGNLRQRAAALLPATLVFAGYVVLYRTLGYGSLGSGLYIDPVAESAAYLSSAMIRIPTLLGGALTGLISDLSIVMPDLAPIQATVGVLAVGLIIGMLKLSWPRLDEKTRGAVLWLGVGSLLATLPVVATFPSDRLLLGPAIGLCAVLSIVIHQCWQRWRVRAGQEPGSEISDSTSQQSLAVKRPARVAWILACAFLVLIHLVWAPFYSLVMQTGIIFQAKASEAIAGSFEASPERDLVLLNAPDHVVAIYLPVIRDHLRLPMPKSWRVLSLAPYNVEISRTSANKLKYQVIDGEMMESIFEVLYRNPDHALRQGDVLHREMLSVEILEVGGHGPTQIAFTFDRSLDDSTIDLMAWRDRELVKIAPPPIGTTIEIERTFGPAGF